MSDSTWPCVRSELREICANLQALNDRDWPRSVQAKDVECCILAACYARTDAIDRIRATSTNMRCPCAECCGEGLRGDGGR